MSKLWFQLVMMLVLALVLLLLPNQCLAATNIGVVAKAKGAVEAQNAATATATATRTASSTTGVLTPTEFQLYTKGLNLITDHQCRRELNATLWGIVSGQRWAISMYDATVKSAFGIGSGILQQFGHFDECLQQTQRMSTVHTDDNVAATGTEFQGVRPKYCLTDVTLNGIVAQDILSRHKPASNHTVAQWGACVPASCDANDTATFLTSLLQRQVAVNEQMCQLQRYTLNINGTMYAYAIVIFFFVFLACLSTSYHVYLICERKRNEGIYKSALRNETLEMALLSFSVIENTKKLLQASKDQVGLNSINGIKALSMLLILAGHALSFIYGGTVYNTAFINDRVKLPSFAFLSNSFLFVDTFLLLSGFLFCRIMLIELERRRGKINILVLYAARYIRLTPAYMAIIGFYITWFPSIGSGPLWQQRIVREQERCANSWWSNILYINNYINTDKLCMFQSWYLAVDSQLFFVAPIAIYLLYRTRKYGLQFLIAMVAVTAALPFVMTFVYKLDPTLLVYSDEMNDLASNTFYVGSYIKTHMRASAYVVGLLTGFLVHVMQEKGTKLPNLVVRATWLISFLIGVAAMFTVCRFYMGPFSNLESTLYSGFHKLGWNLSVAWLVLAVTTGHSGWLQHVLSHRVFAPISRLTYCAYLSNGIVELYHSSSIRSPEYMGYINVTNDVLSHTLDTFLLAFALCLLFESPIHALERILLRKAGGNHCVSSDRKEQTDSRTPSTSEEQVA